MSKTEAEKVTTATRKDIRSKGVKGAKVSIIRV
jgi:hypothetical protein